MKRPVVGLLIQGEDARDEVVSGWKTVTIREGDRDYQVGDRLTLFCPWLNWSVIAEVTYVRRSLAADVLPEDLADAGYKSHEEMVEALRSFGGAYSELTLSSPVTVIRWGDVQGKLVNELAIAAIYAIYRARHKLPLRDIESLHKALFGGQHPIFGPAVKFESVLKSLAYNKWIELRDSGDVIAITEAGRDAANIPSFRVERDELEGRQ